MLVEFSDLNFKILILFIHPVFIKIQDEVKKLYLKDNNFLSKTFKYFASHIFAFIPLLIIKYRSINNDKSIVKLKQETEEKEEDDDDAGKDILTTQSTFLEKRKKGKYRDAIYLGILCIIGFLCYLYRKIFEKDEYWDAKQTIGVFFEIVDFVGLSYILIKQKLFRHHFISLGIIAIVLLILFFVSIPYLDKGYIFSSAVYFLFYNLFFGLFDVLGKRYMMKSFATPYFLMFTVGIINSTLLLIYDVFAYFLNKDVSGIIIGFQNNIQHVGHAFAYILDLIVQSFWIHGIWLTIYYFSPCHYFISEYISEYIYYIMTAVDKQYSGLYSPGYIVIFTISYLIIIVSFLFFNEVLIFNKFNLDYNTKKRIIERMQKENEQSYSANALLEMDYEDITEDRSMDLSINSNTQN